MYIVIKSEKPTRRKPTCIFTFPNGVINTVFQQNDFIHANDLVYKISRNSVANCI